jgi:hypothetical protein
MADEFTTVSASDSRQRVWASGRLPEAPSDRGISLAEFGDTLVRGHTPENPLFRVDTANRVITTNPTLVTMLPIFREAFRERCSVGKRLDPTHA